MATQHFLCIDAGRVFFRSSSSRTYASASRGVYGSLIWHWDGRGSITVRPADATTMKRLRALNTGNPGTPSDAWLNLVALPADLLALVGAGA